MIKVKANSIWRWKINEATSPLSESISGCFETGLLFIDDGRITDLVVTPDDHSIETSEDDSSSNLYEIGEEFALLPGLSDSHIHVSMLGEAQYFLDFSSCFSIDEMRRKIQTHDQNYPDLEWIVGINWDQSLLGCDSI
jgi:predicted amidohydrolase YtcJ